MVGRTEVEEVEEIRNGENANIAVFFQAEDGIRDVERSRGLGAKRDERDTPGVLRGRC